MKRSLTVVVAAGALILLVGAAKAHWGSAYGPGMGGRMSSGMMGTKDRAMVMEVQAAPAGKQPAHLKSPKRRPRGWHRNMLTNI